MYINSITRGVLFSLAAIMGLVMTGCGTSETPETQTPPGDGSIDYLSRDWCVEHAVPESQCGMCNSDLAVAFQQKGDWCQEHNRPESQCFKCDPSRAEKFAKDYETKFGTKPPKPTE